MLQQALAQMSEISVGIAGGAILSSTCTTCMAFQGTSSCARSRSMIQGVLPPLTAMTNDAASRDCRSGIVRQSAWPLGECDGLGIGKDFDHSS
jgi:hypothetical protein